MRGYVNLQVVGSVRTRPSENRKEGLGDGLGDRLRWKYTERNVWNLQLLVRNHFISETSSRPWAQ